MEDDAPDHDSALKQRGYLTCIREEVEPLEAEVERLRALVQELAIALERCVNENGEVWGGELSLIAAAKQQGFVPTNTTEG